MLHNQVRTAPETSNSFSLHPLQHDEVAKSQVGKLGIAFAFSYKDVRKGERRREVGPRFWVLSPLSGTRVTAQLRPLVWVLSSYSHSAKSSIKALSHPGSLSAVEWQRLLEGRVWGVGGVSVVRKPPCRRRYSQAGMSAMHTCLTGSRWSERVYCAAFPAWPVNTSWSDVIKMPYDKF